MAACKRIWEIDFLRGVATVLMVIFHLVVDLTEFHGCHFNYLCGFWYYEGMTSAVLFMFLAGVSTGFNGRCLLHGLKILGWGVAVTVVTYCYTPFMYVRFGILHLIGSGLILSYYTRGFLSWERLLLSIMLFVGGMAAERTVASQGWLLPLGIAPAGFASLDYYPFMPWGGVILLGAWAGGRIYPSPASLLKSEPKPNFLTYIGRRSLWIYLLHQPVLLALLWLLYRV